MRNLLTNVTANDTTKSNAFVTDGARRLSIHPKGTFDGATISLYLSLFGAADGVLLPALTYTAEDFTSLDVADEVTVWAEVTNAGGSTNVSLRISGAGEDPS